jgi:hypothetical protein
MPYEIKPEPNERILLDVDYRASKDSEPFRFAVSDQALYLPSKRLVVAGDPCCFRRVPREEVTEVRVEPLQPYWLWIGAGFMVVTGIFIGGAMLLPFLMQWEGKFRVSGWPLALIVGGLLMPLAARGRRRLTVQLTRGCYRWTPPLVVDGPSKREVANTLAGILEACRAAGLRALATAPEAGSSLQR